MKDILARVAAVPGVEGAAIFDEGALLVGHVRAPLETQRLVGAFHALRSAAEYYCGIEGVNTVRAMAVRLVGGHLLLRRTDHHDLLVACQRSANLAMVTVTLNVAMMKLAQTAAVLGTARRAPTSTFSPSPSAASPPPAAANPAAAMTWADDRTRGKRGGTPVGLPVMRHVLTTYVRYLGAAAQELLERELRRLGHTPQSLDATRFADLIRAAAGHIDDPARRKRFLSDVLGDKPRRR